MAKAVLGTNNSQIVSNFSIAVGSACRNHRWAQRAVRSSQPPIPPPSAFHPTARRSSGTSAIMSGEVMLAQRLGVPLPEGSAFNKDGQPTRGRSARRRLRRLGWAQRVWSSTLATSVDNALRPSREL